MKKFKELTEGMGHKVPVYHAPDKLGEYELIGHVHSSATSVGAAKLAKKKSAKFTKVDGKYGWVAANESYHDAMTSRLPAHLDDPRVEPKPKVAKKPIKRNPKDHSWKLYRESVALDLALEDLTPREKKSGAERLAEPKPAEDYAAKLAVKNAFERREKEKKEVEAKKINLKEGSSQGMSLQQAVAHAKQHGHRIAYGTNSRKWHSIDSSDRDFNSPLSYDPHDAKAVKNAAKFWDPKALKETYEMAYDESGGYKVGDRVIPKIGPHKGEVHKVIHVHDTGHVNIQPERHGEGRKNRYHLGAARAHPSDLDRAPVNEAGDDVGHPWAKKNYYTTTRGKIVKMNTKKSGVNRKTIQEVFAAAKAKQKTDALPTDGANEPNKEIPGKDAQVTTQDGGAPGAQKKSNALKPEKEGKSKKLDVKGPGAEDKFQPEPIVTPLTTMPDTASPKSGSQGVR
jgi:hypothetical protein